ncbi:hypothetical protein [Luteolibacter sp. LG18]|uniref:hypothetical protein n=1 Tax=Luteolibacter sp. LG18 TaxID=2819286 RepID=UPI002B2F7646|nr:hypothetical protein llg_41720 [Luteolibacter sp. LG18]
MKPFSISLLFSALTFAAGRGYWILAGLASWNGGPTDDIAILYYLTVPILLHAILVRRRGMRAAFPGTLLYAAVVAGLCLARHQELAAYPGYDAWHVGRSLTSLWGCLFFFAAGLGMAFLDEEAS